MNFRVLTTNERKFALNMEKKDNRLAKGIIIFMGIFSFIVFLKIFFIDAKGSLSSSDLSFFVIFGLFFYSFLTLIYCIINRKTLKLKNKNLVCTNGILIDKFYRKKTYRDSNGRRRTKHDAYFKVSIDDNKFEILVGDNTYKNRNINDVVLVINLNSNREIDSENFICY